MNTLVIVLISAVCLLCGYMVYGRWLAKTWGIDPKAKTPAYTHEDGQDSHLRISSLHLFFRCGS